MRDFAESFVVPEEKYYVLGDNRERALDSRFFGFVDREAVKGRVQSIYWSMDTVKNVMRWERIGVEFNGTETEIEDEI